MVEKKTRVQLLAEKYKFRVEKDSQHSNIDHLIFEDGRKYKFQHPSFMEFHEIMYGDTSKSLDQIAFLHGLTCIFPENEKSPPINEKYLNANFDESLSLWSPLIRGLLLRD